MESTAAGYAYELIENDQVDLLVAPPCIDAAIVAGHVATYYNVPVTLWGVTFATTLSDDMMYPTIMSVVPNYRDMATVTCEDVINNRSDCIVSFKDIVDSWAPEDINYTLTQMRSKSRIVVLCFDDQDQLRSFALALYDEGMYTDDYVFIIPDSDMSKSVGLDVAPFWIDQYTPSDGRDADAAKVGKQNKI
uniref:Receptor ligand binding region domain-containing protein n=1 Tax=Panagrolaimus superbus TaxID=310955 RepID=A0A914YZ88_9BILA